MKIINGIESIRLVGDGIRDQNTTATNGIRFGMPLIIRRCSIKNDGVSTKPALDNIVSCATRKSIITSTTIERIIASATRQAIVASSTINPVIPISTREQIITGIAFQFVIKVTANEIITACAATQPNAAILFG